MPTRKITRNTETGKFTNKSNAKTDKKGTVVETVKDNKRAYVVAFLIENKTDHFITLKLRQRLSFKKKEKDAVNEVFEIIRKQGTIKAYAVTSIPLPS